MENPVTNSTFEVDSGLLTANYSLPNGMFANASYDSSFNCDGDKSISFSTAGPGTGMGWQYCQLGNEGLIAVGHRKCHHPHVRLHVASNKLRASRLRGGYLYAVSLSSFIHSLGDVGGAG